MAACDRPTETHRRKNIERPARGDPLLLGSVINPAKVRLILHASPGM
jgi:hypothetical protein